MRILVALAVLVSVAAAAELYRGRPELDKKWKEFKSKHGKTYKHSAHESARRKIWEENHDTINRHNNEAASGKRSFTMKLNHLADLTREERAKLLGRKSPENRIEVPVDTSRLDRQAVPDSVDLRNDACLPEVKNQGSCGSCWAFGATTPVEFATCKATGNKVVLSEQQIVDCDTSNNGCNGGFEQKAWKYIISAPGQALSSAYPYTSAESNQGGTCKYEQAMSSSTTIKGVAGFLPKSDLQAIKSLLANQGPLTTALQVLDSFYYVNTGVYEEPACPTDDTTANHVVVIVGYGTLNGIDYWIVRNSWGNGWADGGYALVKRGVNMCNIESNISHPVF